VADYVETVILLILIPVSQLPWIWLCSVADTQ
jgi:hypothetical protein